MKTNNAIKTSTGAIYSNVKRKKISNTRFLNQYIPIILKDEVILKLQIV